MRVKCASVADFLQNLALVNPEDVLQNVVYVSRYFRPTGEETLEDAVKVAVVFQVSAVINIGEEGQYLLEAGEYCGFDYRDATQEYNGTKKEGELRQKVYECCKSYGLSVRPGVIDM